MNTLFDVRMSEVGGEVARGLDEFLSRQLANRQPAEYVNDTPVTWATVDSSGWDLIGAAESDGGADATLRDLVQVAQVVGRWVAPTPIMTTIMAKRWSAAARDHEGPVTFAIDSGARILVPFGDVEGVSVLVDSQSLGLPVAGGDASRDDFAPSLRVVEGREATILSPHESRELVIVWAAEAVGSASRLLDDSVAYVTTREQFGQPVGRFQAMKHKLANALIELQQAESAVYWAASEPGNLTRATRICFDSALKVAEAAIQAHGGLGFTWEMGLHMHLRHILMLRELSTALAEAESGL